MHPQGQRLFAALNGFPDAVDALDRVPADCDAVRLTAHCTGLEALPRLSGMKRLWCFGFGPAELGLVARCEQLEVLYLEEVRAVDFSPLARLRRLETLRVEGATNVADLESFAELTWLAQLGLEHLPRVRSLEPLRALRGLSALDVSGSMWTRMNVASLAPLADLRGLQYLRLTNLKSDDESLAPLAQLSALQELECAGFYPWEQFARLARALPAASCRWFHATSELHGSPCEKCGTARVLLTGKRQPTLCPRCDVKRVEKHRARFLAAGGRAEATVPG